jgi:tripartite-type tricarboxylate transporter receptor subunit TctC
MYMKKIVSVALCLFLALGAVSVFAGGSGESAAAASAEKGPNNYPSKPITFLVGYGAGGGMDICARALEPELEKVLGGVAINVVNKPGATSWIVYE